MDYAPAAVTHLVDYGTISMTWYEALLIAAMYLSLFAVLGLVLFGLIWFLRSRPCTTSSL